MMEDKKLFKAYVELNSSYSIIMSSKLMGFYYRLMWLESHSGLSDFTLENILSDNTGMDENEIINSLKILKILDLIKTPRKLNKNIIKTIQPIKLNKELIEKKVDKLKEKGIIVDVEVIKNKINEKFKDGIEFLKPEEFDFNKPSKKINKDSYPELVRYYYKKLSEIFNGEYFCNNVIKEARNLKVLTMKTGDSPDETRKYINFILETAKSRNEFEKVVSMGLYPYQRNKAYDAIKVNGIGDNKFAKNKNVNDDDLLKNIKEVYDVYKQRNMKEEEIKTKLMEAFEKNLVEMVVNQNAI
jgi:hypothetical protein